MRSARVLAWVALAALLAALAAACGRPPDEAWLRFLGFRAAGATTAVTVLEGQLLDGKTDRVDAAFDNASAVLGSSSAGTGILINRVRVEYRTVVGEPPSFEYPVTLYLPAPSSADSDTSATLSGIPIVPASLKQWIRDSGQPLDPDARFTALVTFFAETDEGNRLEVGGGLAVVLATTGSAAATVRAGD